MTSRLPTKDRVTLFSELISAVAIVFSAGAYLYQSWAATQVTVHAAIVQSTPTLMSILVTNSGGVDTAIRRISVKSNEINGHNAVNIEAGGVLLEKGKSILVRPNPSKLNTTVSADYLVSTNASGKSNISMTDCTADIELVDAKGASFSKSIEFKCVAACVVDLEVVGPTSSGRVGSTNG